MNKYIYNNLEDIPFYYCVSDDEICSFLRKRMDLRNIKIKGVLDVLYPINDNNLKIDKHGVYWVCKCICGKYTIMSHEMLRQDKYHSCGCSYMKDPNRKHCGNSPIDVSGKLFGNLEAIQRIGCSSGGHSVWECRNIITGKIGKYDLGNLTSGDSTGSKNKSHGEDYIESVLIGNKIDYQLHKKFSDCIFPDTNAYAEFDFYIPSKNTIIEYDGIQHFKPTKFGNKDPMTCYEYTKSHDQFKDNYCSEHGIRIIRIPYTMDFDEINNYLVSQLQ